MTIDQRQYAPDQSEVIDPTKLSEVVEQLQTVSNEIAVQEQKVKDLKDQQKQLSNIRIPTLMEEMNLKTLKMKDGSELSIKDVYSATIKADKKYEAYKWLRDNGLGDIVKNTISVAFGQGEENKAMAFATLAKGQGYEPSQEEKVHPSTLKVVLEEWSKKGNEVPADLFWLFEGKQTKLKNKQ
tara:strand:- start:219 stop:767 length:549 start_codon:yes stop_codon:yes gene_type:complete